MKLFANKSIWKKIIIIIGALALITVVFPKPVAAVDIGGVLMDAITGLFVGLADGAMTIIHKVFVEQERVFYIVAEGILWIKLAIIGVLIASALVLAHIISLPAMIVIGAALLITFGLEGGGTNSVTYQTVSAISNNMFGGKDSITLSDINLSPYEIFSDENGIFNVNFFRYSNSNANTSTAQNNNDQNPKKQKPIVEVIGENISDWYRTLTLIAVVGMLSVLVYIGIRITLSSASESKAKYKQMLGDWLVAMFLIFVMRYIMIFSNLLVEQITDALGSVKISSSTSGAPSIEMQGVEGFLLGTKADENGNIEVDDDMTPKINKAYEILVDNGEGNKQNTFASYFWKDASGTQASSKDDAKVLFWPAHNFTAQARMKLQLVKEAGGSPDFKYVGYVIIYVALVIYTCIFIFVYIRRLIYMIFLTLISPLVALTYPIDKVKDGQAQAFNYWFREYIFNLLLQPLHLLLYMLLIGSAMKFAADNVIYVIVCLGFMVPAERLLKEMFGFKGKTPGSMPGLATGALMMHATRNLFGKKTPIKGPGGNNSLQKGNSSDDDDGLNFKKPQTFNNNRLFAGVTGGNSGEDSGGTNTQEAPASLETANRPRGTNAEIGSENNERDNRLQLNGNSDMRDAEVEEKGFPGQTFDDLAFQEAEISSENNNDSGRKYTDDEYWNILRDSNPGMSDEEIAQMYGYEVPNNPRLANGNSEMREAKLGEMAENYQIPTQEQLSEQDAEINYENNNNDNGRKYTDDEYWNILRDSNPGMSDEEIAQSYGIEAPNRPRLAHNLEGPIPEQPIRQQQIPQQQIPQQQIPPQIHAQLNSPQQTNGLQTPQPSIRKQQIPIGQIKEKQKNQSNPRKIQPRRIAGAAGRTILSGAKGKIGTVKNSELLKRGGKKALNTAKDALEIAGGIATGAAGATLGITAGGFAGLVTGDPSKAFEYMTAGGVAGYNLTSNAGRITVDAAANNIAQAYPKYKEEYYAGHADEYNEKKMEEYINNWMKNEKNRSILIRGLDKKTYKEMVKNGEIKEFLKTGNKDAKDLVATKKFNKRTGMDFNDSLSVLQMNKELRDGIEGVDSDKFIKHVENKFMRQMNIKDRNDKRVQDNVDKVKGYLKQFNDIKTGKYEEDNNNNESGYN